MNTVYVAGYPKSGTTWLTRLLGDALNCPTGGFTAEEDCKEIATEGQERCGKMVVRKGHFVLSNETNCMSVPRAHVLAWRCLTASDKVVHILRDPRDIVVSGAHHWKVSPETFLDWMIAGTNGVRHTGIWSEYILSWLQVEFPYFLTTYEKLHTDTYSTILALLQYLGSTYSTQHIKAVCVRQAFDVRKAHIQEYGDTYPRGQEFNLRFMRKGIVGDGVATLEPEMLQKIETVFGDLMLTQGYV